MTTEPSVTYTLSPNGRNMRFHQYAGHITRVSVDLGKYTRNDETFDAKEGPALAFKTARKASDYLLALGFGVRHGVQFHQALDSPRVYILAQPLLREALRHTKLAEKEPEPWKLKGEDTWLPAEGDNSWNPWHGHGDSPVAPGTMIDVKHRNGEIIRNTTPGGTGAVRWEHTDDVGDGWYDIMAWRPAALSREEPPPLAWDRRYLVTPEQDERGRWAFHVFLKHDEGRDNERLTIRGYERASMAERVAEMRWKLQLDEPGSETAAFLRHHFTDALKILEGKA